MANVSVYKLQLISDSRDEVISLFPLQQRKEVENVINKFEAHNICIKDNSKILLPGGSILTNGKEIIEYYLNPGIKQKPKNIKEIDDILINKKISTSENIITNKKTLTSKNTDDILINKKISTSENFITNKKTLTSKNTLFEWINL